MKKQYGTKLSILFMIMLCCTLSCSDNDGSDINPGNGTDSSQDDTGDDDDTSGDDDDDTSGDDDDDTSGDDDDDTSGDDDDDNDTSDTSTDVCDESFFHVIPKDVDILIVLDRSNSMSDDGLWLPMGAALADVTAKMESKINFGLMVFPNESCESNENACVSGEKIIDIQENNAEAIAAKVGGGSNDVGTCGGTPIAQSLVEAKTYLDSLGTDTQKYVLLATDGAPNCNPDVPMILCVCTSKQECPDSTHCLDSLAANASAQALNDAGYPTFVLGIGNSLLWALVMNGIAGAGGTDNYYPAEGEQLPEVLEAIVSETVSCEFDVDWDSIADNADDDPSKVNFYCKQDENEPNSDDNLVLYDEGCQNGTGWAWTDDTHTAAKFCDQSCSKLRSGECSIVTATFGCETIVIQ